MRKFLKKLLGFSVGPVVGGIISFITVPITTIFISPTEFGKASMFTVIYSLFLSVIYLGIDQSYTKEFHYIKDKKKLLQNAIFLPLIASFISLLLLIIFKTQMSNLLFGQPQYGSISVLLGLTLIFGVFERFILLLIRMEEHSIEYSTFSIIVKAAVLVMTLIYIFLGKRDFLVIVYSTILGQIFADVIIMIKYRNYLGFNKIELDKPLLKRMLWFGLPLIVAASVNNLLNTSGRFFLRGYSSFEELGIYTASLKVASVLQIIQAAFTSFWVPVAYRWHKEEKDIKHFSAISDILLLVICLGFFILILFKGFWIKIIASDYSDAQYTLGLLSMPPILYTLSETSTLGIVFSGKSYFNIIVSVLSLFPNLILNYLLVPKYGTVGAAISIAFSFVIFCIARTYFSNRCGFKIPFKKQIVAIILLFGLALINVADKGFVPWITFIIFVLLMIVQIPTIKTIYSIYKNPKDWNFE